MAKSKLKSGKAKTKKQLASREGGTPEEESLADSTELAPQKGKKRQRNAALRLETTKAVAPQSKKQKVGVAKPAIDTEAGVAEDDDEEGDREARRAPQASEPTALFKKDMSFTDLKVGKWLVDSCNRMGMHYPTEIQAMSIPPILENKNVAGNAKTGSGKTACYCLPILHALSQDPYGVFALILLPVRELVFQVSENFQALGKSINVKVAEVVGGLDMNVQTRKIADRAHVVIATPGRLSDLLQGDPDLVKAMKRLRFFVLDEADQLLTPPFEKHLSTIINVLPKTRQTLLFSATLTKSIETLKEKIPGLVIADANPHDATLDNLTQEYIFVPKTIQFCYLNYLLANQFEGWSCIIFAPTITVCQLITNLLEFLEYPVAGLHAMQSQRVRQASLGKFRAGRVSILVATDVACRGLDLPKVAVVINMNLPSDTDTYVHRAGRTARAGRPGLVLSLMTERDVPNVHAIEERIGKKLELRPTDEAQALKLMSRTTKARQKAELLLSEIGFQEQVAERHRQASKVKPKKRIPRPQRR